jgi:hypothetical protein
MRHTEGMRRLLLAAVLALSPAALAKDRPRSVPCAGATCTSFASAAEAFARVVAKQPRILGIGEYHQLEGSTAPSALHRFTQELLPRLRGRAAELVVETWITDGKCGEVEKQVVGDVKVETRRPAATENEVLTLGIRAKKLGIPPTAVNLTCAQYATVLAKDGSLDDEQLLLLVAKLLGEKALRISAEHHALGDDRTVVIYGGALHNDLAPDPALAGYSYAPGLVKALGARYLELDLYVPEYVAADEEVTAEPWFPATSRKARGARTLLVERGPASFAIVFPETAPKQRH